MLKTLDLSMPIYRLQNALYVSNLFAETIHKKITKGDGHSISEEKSVLFNVVSDTLHRSMAQKDKMSLDLHLSQHLCRFHLEDSRRLHMKMTGHREVEYGPSIHVNHAITLLAGKDLEVKSFSIARQWPLFSLFLQRKSCFRNLIKGEYYHPFHSK